MAEPPPARRAAATIEPSLPEELMVSLSDDTVLRAFRRLPIGDQKNFIRWVGTVDPAERKQRAVILRDALLASPLAWAERPDLPNRKQR